MMAIPAFTLARRLRAGETVFSGWCSLPYPIVAETLGTARLTGRVELGALWSALP